MLLERIQAFYLVLLNSENLRQDFSCSLPDIQGKGEGIKINGMCLESAVFSVRSACNGSFHFGAIYSCPIL